MFGAPSNVPKVPCLRLLRGLEYPPRGEGCQGSDKSLKRVMYLHMQRLHIDRWLLRNLSSCSLTTVIDTSFAYLYTSISLGDPSANGLEAT